MLGGLLRTRPPHRSPCLLGLLLRSVDNLASEPGPIQHWSITPDLRKRYPARVTGSASDWKPLTAASKGVA
jgi:hypothetical protein